MRLKKLEIYGFKSFAERTEIVFEQGITGIVGPNGSGKSNIADAVKWVLGEQNARSLRGGKMEDIIFGGTEKRKKLGYCEVSLTFDNQDMSLSIDYSEVQVTRRVYRSGESEYMLNKTPCRLKDVIDLFRDTGIGKEGYSLIGQGRIDEILSVKSEDRRQVFEEAAGIVKYKVRKEEAERRMENTRQNLLRVEDIIEELGNQLEPLAQQSETARRYLAMRDELRGLELNAFLLRNDRYKERIETVGKNLAGLAEAIAQGEAEEKSSTAKRIELEESLAALDRQLNEAHETVTELTRVQEVHEGEHNVLRADLAHIGEEQERLAAESAEAEQRMKALDELLGDSEGGRTEQDALLGARRKETEAADRAVAELQAETEEKEAALEKHKAAIIASMNRQSDMRTHQTRLITMRQSLEKRLEELGGEQTGNTEEGDRLAEAVKAARQESETVAAQMGKLKAEADRLDEQVRAGAQHTEALSQKLAEQKGEEQALSSRLRVLREMERDYAGYQHAVKQVLLKGKQEKGVHGIVASLLRVPKDYEKAVEAVLGAALQNIVTEDEYVAKRMIDYLRQNQFGRATFLPITAVKGRTLNAEERRLLSMPGCLGLASELVTFDTPYRGVMESLLGRTVIAKDLDSGIAIMRAGRQAFRLVTLEGDVMHSGGSMTGGSAQARSTSLLSREREIEECEQAIERLGKDIAATREELTRLEAQRAEDKRLRGEIFAQLHQEEIAVAREQERLSRAEEQMTAHLHQLSQKLLMREQIEDNLRDIAGELTELDDSQSNAETDAATMHALTQTLQAALLDARARLEKEREKATEQRVALASLERDVEALRRDAARQATEKQALVHRMAQHQTKTQQVAERTAHVRQQLEQGERQLAACQQQLADANTALAALNQQREGLHSSLRAQGEQLDAARERVNADIDKHHRAELQLTRLEGELKQMQDRIWEEYELSYAGAMEYKVEGFELGPAEKQIDSIRAQIREMGSVNVNAIEDYRACRTRYDDLCTQREDLTRAEEDLQGIIAGLLVKMEKQFREQFAQLAIYFTQTFSRLFGGGHAELKLLDPSDVLNCGIEIVAQPPGKKLQLLTLLSGGERALTAIAILFAMLRLKPTPFCILDEIEAALDDANINHFADFLSEFSRGTQFVVVTHRKGTMERCDALYGVAMEEKGVSRMVSVQLTDNKTA